MTDAERMEAARDLFKGWRSKAMEEIQRESSPDFAAELGQLAMENVFSKLWLRDGLDLRSRSLVTVAMLIALRAHEELRVHFPIALKNGCTVKELEEVIYQASAYAGFPAASTARRIATKTLRDEEVIA